MIIVHMQTEENEINWNTEKKTKKQLDAGVKRMNATQMFNLKYYI